MRKFQDSNGREWPIALNLGVAKRLKAEDFDLLDPACLQRLADSPYEVANVLFLICEEEAKAAGIDDAKFGAGLSGDVIDNATEALLLEIVDFFPKRQRETLKTWLAKMEAAKGQAMTMAQEKLSSPQMSQAIERAMKQSSDQIDEILAKVGTQSGAPLESPALSPGA